MKAPEVVVLGHVKRALLPPIYHGASLFAFPTLYEGFGLPLLEAMAGRLPIVTSNTGAAPEVAGDGAMLVDPLSVAEIGNAMERNPGECADVERFGRRRTPAGASFHVGKDGCSHQSFLREGFGIAALDSNPAPPNRASQRPSEVSAPPKPCCNLACCTTQFRMT